MNGDYDGRQYVGIDLHRRRSVIVRMTPEGEHTRGALTVRMTDGAEETFRAGEVMLLPPGHHAWCAGDEARTFVEFSRGNDYYVA